MLFPEDCTIKWLADLLWSADLNPKVQIVFWANCYLSKAAKYRQHKHIRCYLSTQSGTHDMEWLKNAIDARNASEMSQLHTVQFSTQWKLLTFCLQDITIYIIATLVDFLALLPNEKPWHLQNFSCWTWNFLKTID